MKRRLTCCVECVFLLFQEGIAIESNHFIRNPVCSQKVAHCFCDKQDDLDKVWVNETSPYRSGSPTIVGRMYVKAPVSSNIITTTDTVRRITPLSNVGVTCTWVTKGKPYLNAAAAPKNAYVPGVIHGTSGWQTANIPDLGYALSVGILSVTQLSVCTA